MNKRNDFFSYYKTAVIAEAETNSNAFKIYESLLLETWDFFDKYDMMKGTIIAKIFEDLYINCKMKNQNDIAYDNGIALRTLFDYRTQFDAFAIRTLKRRNLSIQSAVFLPIQFE